MKLSTRPDPLIFSALVTRPDPWMDPTRGQLWYSGPSSSRVLIIEVIGPGQQQWRRHSASETAERPIRTLPLHRLVDLLPRCCRHVNASYFQHVRMSRICCEAFDCCTRCCRFVVVRRAAQQIESSLQQIPQRLNVVLVVTGVKKSAQQVRKKSE